MDSNTQRKSPMFAEVNVERQAKEFQKREDRPKRRFTVSVNSSGSLTSGTVKAVLST